MCLRGGNIALSFLFVEQRIHHNKRGIRRDLEEQMDSALSQVRVLKSTASLNYALYMHGYCGAEGTQAISEHLCKVGKYLRRKSGRPSLTESPSNSRRRSPLLSNPVTPVSPRKMRNCPKRHQGVTLNCVRTDNIGHWPS
ncbi:hypothetical protein WA026_002001 [Henosepilachna vigintioctopunctata]|uniref:Uncharacterized protein n=1 Tax=Henosepilachna vigintioctopunctata TaxID=420089 RepID=A0AAW1USP4_9CUCU